MAERVTRKQCPITKNGEFNLLRCADNEGHTGPCCFYAVQNVPPGNVPPKPAVKTAPVTREELAEALRPFADFACPLEQGETIENMKGHCFNCRARFVLSRLDAEQNGGSHE